MLWSIRPSEFAMGSTAKKLTVLLLFCFGGDVKGYLGVRVRLRRNGFCRLSKRVTMVRRLPSTLKRSVTFFILLYSVKE